MVVDMTALPKFAVPNWKELVHHHGAELELHCAVRRLILVFIMLNLFLKQDNTVVCKTTLRNRAGVSLNWLLGLSSLSTNHVYISLETVNWRPLT